MSLLEDRFWSKVDKDGPVQPHRPELGPCWLWTGGLTPDGEHDPGGYARFSINSAMRVSAVRLAWSLVKGEKFPAGLVPDHLCHTGHPTCPGGRCIHRRCINPSHVEPVTQRENNMRTNRTGTETHCPSDHEFTPENTYITPSGTRQCRKCKTEAMRRHNKANPGRTTRWRQSKKEKVTS